MKRFTIFCLVLLGVSPILFAQKVKNKKTDFGSNNADTIVLVTNLNLKLVGEIPKIDNKSTDLNKMMPWIGAIFVGIITVGVNFWVSHRLRKTTLEVSRANIESNNRNSAYQIKLLKENSIREFNKTVVSGNRQVWLAEFRATLASIIDLLSSFKIKQAITQDRHAELKLLLIKAELMLSADDEDVFVLKLRDLDKFCHDVLLKLTSVHGLDKFVEDLKLLTVSKIKKEWVDIQRN